MEDEILTESLELVAFGDFRLVVSVSWGDFVPIDNDSVVVDLTKAIGLLQVVPADLVVEWNVVSLSKSRNTHVNVMDSRIVVDKDNVVVEDKDVEDEHSELHHECHEESDEARRLSFLIVIVELEQVSIKVLISHINDADQEEVETCCNAVPSDKFADWNWEATDKFIAKLTHHDQEKEQ